ncbi:MAG: methionine synthase [Oscillospiraceae bacterium]
MVFSAKLELNLGEVLPALGYKAQKPDAGTQRRIETAAKAVQAAAAPRWVYRQFGLLPQSILENTNVALPGSNIAAHLAGCTSCILLALTLGGAVDAALRAAEAADMTMAVIMDVCASTLIEQYADEAQTLLQAEQRQQHQFITGRFSPGYGDFPLDIQPEVLRLLNASRSIGLTANASNILLPRKSITAVIGVAEKPVKGKLATCTNCALREKCVLRKEGKYCGG